MAGNSPPGQTGVSKLGSVESPDDTGGGSLLFRRADGSDLYLAPLVATEVTIDVGGIIARSNVRQTFVNPTDQWLEGIYVFPLPENASVDRLEMEVGGRTILGVIKEREAARQSYEEAREQGQRAALLESERPNVFTSSVANIAPGASIAITFEYQQKLRYDPGGLSPAVSHGGGAALSAAGPGGRVGRRRAYSGRRCPRAGGRSRRHSGGDG